MLREENATVLPFRDAAMRRPIDVVAWKDTRAQSAAEPRTPLDNVVSMARFARASRRGAHRGWSEGPPEGHAA